MVGQLIFVNAAHEKAYADCKALIASERARQSREAARLFPEWERLPPELRAEKMAWLENHFAESLKPYERVMADLLSLCTYSMVVPANVFARSN